MSDLDIPRESRANCLEKRRNTGNDRGIHSPFPGGTNCMYSAVVKVPLPMVIEQFCQ